MKVNLKFLSHFLSDQENLQDQSIPGCKNHENFGNYQNSPNYYRSLNGWTSSSNLLLCSECSSWKDESGVKRRSSFCPIFTRHRHADVQCWVWSFNWILLLTTRKIYDITFKARVVKLFSKHIYDLFVENLSVTDLQQQTRNPTLTNTRKKFNK